MRPGAGATAVIVVAAALLACARGQYGDYAYGDGSAVGVYGYGGGYYDDGGDGFSDNDKGDDGDYSDVYGGDYGNAVGPQFNSPACEWVCKDPNEFETPLPPEPLFELNRAHDWGIVLLNQIQQNLPRLSPPGVSRIIGIFSSCIHDAVAYDEAYGMRPVYASKASFAPGLELDRVIDGAAFTALQAAFGSDASFQAALDFLDRVSEASGGGRGRHGGNIPFDFGSRICGEVIEIFTADGFKVDGNPLPGNGFEPFVPYNSPQLTPGITNCEVEIKSSDYWQPLCVPTFFGSQDCNVQGFLSPDAGAWTRFALVSGDVMRPFPPPYYAQAPDEYLIQAREVVDFSAGLTDVNKMLAEFWADGRDTTAPPGHWYRIALDAAVNEGLSVVDTVKVMFLVGSALNDAGVASWDAKRHYNFARPITMIQCGLGGETVEAWVGPYLGVGQVAASRWQPYQAATFVTPAFPGYVSGHSTFSAAASRALQLFFNNEEYRAPKCRLIREGQGLYERRIDVGEPGFVDGLTNVPNNGPRTPGYSPATDVVLCWERWEDAGLESGVSRFHGGIHIRADHDSGVVMGYQIADLAFQQSASHWGYK